MSPETRFEPATNRLPEAAREVAHLASDAVEESARVAKSAVRNVNGALEDATTNALDAATNAATRATDTAKNLYRSAASHADEAVTTSKAYTTRHPARVVIGAFVLGAAIGFLLTAGRRSPSPNLHIGEAPLFAVRDAILDAIAPATKRVHEGYASAKDSAGKVADRVQRMAPRPNGHGLSDQIGRIGNNLKFW